MLLLVSLTAQRAIYFALELDRSWTETVGVARLWTLRSSEIRVAARDDLPVRAVRALTKFIRSRDLSSSELRYG